MRSFKRVAVLVTLALFLGLLFVQGVEARRGGGGRGGGRSMSRSRMSRPSPRRSFNRSGPASRGSFSGGRRARPAPVKRTRPSPSRGNRMTRPSQVKRARPSRTRDRVTNGSRRNRDTTRRQDRMANREERRKNQSQRRKDRAAEGTSKRQKAQEAWKDRQEDRQDFIEDIQEDRQDFIEDMYDDHWDHYHGHYYYGGVATGVVVGTAAAVTYVTTLPCTAKVVDVNGVHYYSCGSTWYRRSYSGSQVTYIVVDPPPGY